jgi:hypothetical protein
MKTLFITIAEDMIARNLFFTDFWPTFYQGAKEYRIIFLVKKEKVELYKNFFKGTHVVVEAYVPSPKTIFSRFLMTLARSSLRTKTNLWSKMRSYERGDSGLLSTYTKRVFTFVFGGSSLWKHLLRRLILTIRPNEGLAHLFDTYTPDVLFVSSMTNFEFDVPVAVEAKRRGVKTVGMVRSWDNLSSHGMLRVVPDILFLQNSFLAEMAYTYQALQHCPIKVVGVPHYDCLKNIQDVVMSREDFFRSKGLDPNKKVLFYGAMGNFLFIHENEMPAVLDTMIKNLGLQDSYQLLYRVHPKFKIENKKLGMYTNIVFDFDSTYINTWDMSEIKHNESDFASSLYYADIVLTCGSTVAIDAAVMNKPVICVAFDGLTPYSEVSYWNSVRRFYDCYTHFEELVKTGSIGVAYDSKELERMVSAVIQEKHNTNTVQSIPIIKRFVAPFDGKSGERVATLLLKEIKHD